MHADFATNFNVQEFPKYCYGLICVDIYMMEDGNPWQQ